mmetsp:Transcript_4568/g.9214  ORF Transcript_4568/g.9214 Transcript_4568/m.9214 type:complete len:121 (+) Transcript_4568:152-514(+)
MEPGKVYHCQNIAEYHAALSTAGDRLVVVDCSAQWCPPCAHMAPIFESLSAEYKDVVFVKVDVDDVPEIKKVLTIWALPTFYFLRYGNKVGSFMGADEWKLRHGLENNGIVSLCNSCEIL